MSEWPQPGGTVHSLKRRDGQWMYTNQPFELDGIPSREYRVVDDRPTTLTTDVAQAAGKEKNR